MHRDKKEHLSRREFLINTGLKGLAIGFAASCAQETPRQAAERSPSSKKKPGKKQPPIDAHEPFAVIEAKGSPFEIGREVGQKLRPRIGKSIERQRQWFDDLKGFALADRKNRMEGFVRAVEKRHPEIMAELTGLAEGAGLALDDILVLNFQAELGALKSKAKAECDACSTFHLVREGGVLLAHNEDGNDAYRDLMAIARIRPKGKPAFTAVLYPGLIAGNVPAINDQGLVMTTNFIGANEVRIGVPRYVLGRAVLEASSLDEAVKIATAGSAAYSFHLNLGSTKEKRLVAVDVSATRCAVQETKGLFLQTNHFVLPGTKDIPQDANTPGGSSDSRYRTLAKAMETLPPIEQITADHLIKLLSSHEAVTQPYSPCRHPAGNVRGRTLATALFDLTANTFTLYEGNPCERRRRNIEIA